MSSMTNGENVLRVNQIPQESLEHFYCHCSTFLSGGLDFASFLVILYMGAAFNFAASPPDRPGDTDIRAACSIDFDQFGLIVVDLVLDLRLELLTPDRLFYSPPGWTYWFVSSVPVNSAALFSVFFGNLADFFFDLADFHRG